MEQIGLSKRLQKVASYVPVGARLADIGSDHAYLPLFLAEKGKIHFAIAGEVVRGPYELARQHVEASVYADRISVRLANGLAAIDKQDAITCVSIAGMGGRLIAEILEAGKEKLAGVESLILQPNNRADDVRTWLEQHGFAIVAEEMLEENKKYYEIIFAQKGEMTLSHTERYFGPFLMREKSPIFIQKWQKERFKLEQALVQVPERHMSARASLMEKIENIKEVLDVRQSNH